MSNDIKISILKAEVLQLIAEQLLGIREELHQANKLTIEKQKADLNRTLTKAEKEWLIDGAV
jgi:hypothetical protein